jgi:cobalt/nickel transport system permease protein
MSLTLAISCSTATAEGPLHTLDPRAKMVGFLSVVITAVSFPANHHLALLGSAAILGVLAVISRLRIKHLVLRFVQLTPFLAVAALLPFTHPMRGLSQAVGEMAQAMIGCLAMVMLAATTPVERLLSGLVGLRCPAVVVLLLSVLIRYLHLLGQEAGRLRRAATARGYAPRSLRQTTFLGHIIGALFLRSHARAERVHAAMLARGFDGTAIAEPPPPMSATDYLFLVVVVGVNLAWRIVAP